MVTRTHNNNSAVFANFLYSLVRKGLSHAYIVIISEYVILKTIQNFWVTGKEIWDIQDNK